MLRWDFFTAPGEQIILVLPRAKRCSADAFEILHMGVSLGTTLWKNTDTQ